MPVIAHSLGNDRETGEGEHPREMFGPDVAASVTTSELRQLVEGVRYLSAALAAPVDKDKVATELSPMRALFGRSLVARCALPAGHVLVASDVTAKKPAGGIPPARLESLISRRLRRAVRPDEPLDDSDLEPLGPHSESLSSPER